MTTLIREYTDFDAFAREWKGDNEQDTRMLWQLLGQLDDDEVLIQIPEWLAEEKVGFVDGRTPTEFIGRIERETEKAILLADSAAARPLMKIAHRIASLEEGSDRADADRREWLEDRLEDHLREFEDRDEIDGLQDGWVPKSQILSAVRRLKGE